MQVIKIRGGLSIEWGMIERLQMDMVRGRSIVAGSFPSFP